MYKVLLVDDEKLLLESLEIILSLNGMEIVGKANDGKAALKLLQDISEKKKQASVNQEEGMLTTEPICDIALVDLNMKGMGGIALIRLMKEKYATIKILVLTTFYDDKCITEAITGGADGYLLKDSGKDAIIGAITQILGGITVLDQKVMARLTELMAGNLSTNTDSSSKMNEGQDAALYGISSNMTAREKEVCSLMVLGLTNRQIADRLYISEGTVKNYISGIYDKTGIHDRVKLIVELKK